MHTSYDIFLYAIFTPLNYLIKSFKYSFTFYYLFLDSHCLINNLIFNLTIINYERLIIKTLYSLKVWLIILL